MAVEAQLQVLAQACMVDLVKFHQKKYTWPPPLGPCDGSACVLLTPEAKAPFTKPQVCFPGLKQALKIQQRDIIFVFSGTFTIFFVSVKVVASGRTVKWE